MKNVLILGKDSYLGENFKLWMEKYSKEYHIDITGTINGVWREKDFSKYDTVVNFAGIAHIKNITGAMEKLFYAVNRDLAITMCEHAKLHGVKQFIQLSSMNVYGDLCGEISDRSRVWPTSFYGKSKLEGDIGIQALSSENFIVASVRPPFVYGKGCPGNYNSVKKIALKLHIFPTYKNKKSMIYIYNLCEFLRLVIENSEGGILTPQNIELLSTMDLVKAIAKANKQKMLFTGVLNWMIPISERISGIVRKAFRDDYYRLSLSEYYNWEYCIFNFDESIIETEKNS